MATFDRFFKYALRDGKAVITPKGKEIHLTLEPYDLIGAYWDNMRLEESELISGKGWAAIDLKKKQIKPDERGRYCLRIELNQSDSYYTGGYFYYLPKEQVIELDHPDNRSMSHIEGIGEESLKSILSRFYDKLPPIRSEPV